VTTTIPIGGSAHFEHVTDEPRGDLVEYGEKKLRNLCSGLRVDAQLGKSALAAFHRLTHPWLASIRPRRPTWPSDITDDHSPFEFSVSVEPGRFDIRILVEAQDERMTEHQGWDPAIALTERLANEPGVSLERFERIRECFVPDRRIRARFSLWHACVVRANGPVLYKAYLNPHVLGAAAAPGLVREALERFDMADAWRAVEQLLAASPHNELLYVALDLASGVDAAVKVYVAHHGARIATLEQQLRAFSRQVPGTATRLIEQTADHQGPFRKRPPLTCLGFTGASHHPVVTLHFPIRCYARDDQQIVDRASALLGENGGPQLAAGIAQYAARPLNAGRGLVTYLSVRRSPTEDLRMVAYLSPEVYRVEAPAGADVPKAASMIDVMAHVAKREAELTSHPFIDLLRRPASVFDVATFVRGMTFFVMSFQDVLRLTAREVRDPRLTKIAATHFAEDAGHEQWFLHDLEKFGIDVSLGYAFSRDHEVARDLGYALVAEVLQAKDDVDRLAVVLALEGAGHAFFDTAISFFEKRNLAEGLRYFARRHQQVESNHEIFGGDVHQSLSQIELTSGKLAEALATVDRVFDKINELPNDLFERVTRAA
jgi:DMATS type aromatic prenyltransferase